MSDKAVLSCLHVKQRGKHSSELCLILLVNAAQHQTERTKKRSIMKGIVFAVFIGLLFVATANGEEKSDGSWSLFWTSHRFKVYYNTQNVEYKKESGSASVTIWTKGIFNELSANPYKDILSLYKLDCSKRRAKIIKQIMHLKNGEEKIIPPGDDEIGRAHV